MVVLACGFGLIGLAVASHLNTPTEPRRRAPRLDPTDPYTNIHAGDYVGPEACRECHAENYAKWRKHPHSRMNQNADEESVVGDFSGASIDYDGYRVVFERLEGDYVVSLHRGDVLARRYRVTRTVGSRLIQMYVGVQIHGPEPEGDPAYTQEAKLPFGYWFARERWYPESYFDTDFLPERGAEGEINLEIDQPKGFVSWEDNCLWCHNTYPYETRVRPGGLPGFRVALSTGTSDPATLDSLITLGISCESCHFGGRVHVADDDRPMRFVPSSPKLTTAYTVEEITTAQHDPTVIRAICKQCHSSGVRTYPDGTGTWNSREALEMEAGDCASEMLCTDCHNPHEASPLPGGGADDPAHLATCLRCHADYAKPDARRAHTRHTDAQASCLDCHMPRMVQGLSAVTRTHRIGSPTDAAMLSVGAPNACNLCHLDRSITWTVQELEKGWGAAVTLDPEATTVYGPDLSKSVGEAWLGHSAPVVRLIGADAHSRSTLVKEPLAKILANLSDRFAVNRMFAMFAIERLLGRRLDEEREYSPMADPAVREQQIKALRELLAR
jgi:hypothetical protein